ncbi:4-hydroxy-tetrahydrodipicolinate synthase [Lentibacillus cibarius]|uniref:4-hydroxy-tetrahydrodipicolinate synthase n=1 Tax=Lentibacillus cibarius TaxID=2583219 RepID=A0A549YI25_9BACI|nr:4-hydroxy-tetrahydrodipicolinate synthase [Lentibacillus cibarius]TMN22742.1 4-hydroxy-tetrahydrodipicolinate synthase [Lentibacillus cibarius]TRM11530.1 4-hydroxy-tetrahydrodipicolinate synthase [Lentibacillus cibarius]
MYFGQVLTAMVTPFDQHGDIDFNATRTLVNHLITNGSEGLVVAGTTGESPTLTTDEKLDLFAFVAKVTNGRVPVIAGTGSNSTKASIRLTQQAESTGVDGIMVVTPYYNKPSQEGMFQHFQAIAQSTTLPVMLYNIPGRSVVNLSVETTVRLSKVPNIVAIKEASGDLDAMTKIISQTSPEFTLYTGEDSLTLPTLAIGGAGVVSVSSHIVGNEMQDMITSYKHGNVQEAASIHQHILPIMKAMFAQPSPSPLKEALNMQGVTVGNVRLPMIPLNEEEKRALHQLLQSYVKKVS